MKTKLPSFHTFDTEAYAVEAWLEVDRIGRARNGQATVAHRNGKTVTIRPEYDSAPFYLRTVLRDLARSF